VTVIGSRDQHRARARHREPARGRSASRSAGGFDEFADRSNVRVVRRQRDGKEIEYTFDYDAYIPGRAPNTNFLLQAGM
jgi:hypothetical protein